MLLILLAILACPPGCPGDAGWPCLYADRNCDGHIDYGDVLIVLEQIQNQDLAGDVNCDGNVDADDLADQITNWFACTE